MYRPGDVIGDRYEVARVLSSRGGFGVVYQVVDLAYGIDRALKLLRPDPAGDSGRMRDLFKREVSCLVKLAGRSPGIVGILDFGVEHEPWIVMELIPGPTLEEVIEAEGALPLARVQAIMGGVLDGVATIHGAEGEILHLDLKPRNIILRQPGDQPVILDLGIAQLKACGFRTLDGLGLAGTPGWMAPEQLQGEQSRQSDLYACGLIAYLLLTGRHPLILSPADSADTIMRRTLEMDRPPPLPPHLADLEPIVVKALARDPADRWESALEMRHALFGALAAHRGVADAPSQHATQPVPGPCAEPDLRLFVHCGQRFAPDRTWECLALPASITAEDLGPIIREIRERLRDIRHAQLLIAGPVCLGVAVGIALEHLPTRVEFIQLNQRTKAFEAWVRNTDEWD